jgi:hypothetical protein
MIMPALALILLMHTSDNIITGNTPAGSGGNIAASLASKTIVRSP